MRVRASAIAALTAMVAAAALVTGCGVGSPEQKANEAYASNVCMTIGSWLTEVKSVRIPPPLAGITKASIDASLTQYEAATRQFVSRIKAARAPNSSEGQAARKKIEQSPLITGARGDIGSVRTVESTVAAARNGTTAVMDALGGLPDLRSLKPTAQSLLTYLQSGRGSLASAFKTERPCKQLG